MNYREAGRQRGRQAGAALAADAYRETIATAFRRTAQLYPGAQFDFPATLRQYDADRLADEPSLTRFPELRGHRDFLLGEREGFREATGLDETASSFRYSWWHFITRRLNARYLARYDLVSPLNGCTNVLFPHGADGFTLADNRDDVLYPEYAQTIPKHRPEHLLRHGDRLPWCLGGVSAAVLYDDEPACTFPANPHEYDHLLPPEALDNLTDLMAFMQRYGDFWGPGNQLWLDRQHRCVAVEKTNTRLAYRLPTVAGAVAVTACAYLDDGLHAHHMERVARVMREKGETPANSVEVAYHRGARARYQRLVALTEAEAARPGGATLWGALEVVADHAVPFPDRVCLAGEKTFPEREPNANWSVTEHAAVLTGPRRRCLYRSVQDFAHPRPVYEEVPWLMLGSGVAMAPEWAADVAAGRCRLADPVA
jgi:hypothetical protein